jgi:hypothetical protein
MNVNCWARRPQTRGSPDPLATRRIPAPALRSYTTPEPGACDVALRVVRGPRTVRALNTYTLKPTRLAITPSSPLLEVFALLYSPDRQPISADCPLPIKHRARRPSRAVERILLAVRRRTCSPQNAAQSSASRGCPPSPPVPDAAPLRPEAANRRVAPSLRASLPRPAGQRVSLIEEKARLPRRAGAATRAVADRQ